MHLSTVLSSLVPYSFFTPLLLITLLLTGCDSGDDGGGGSSEPSLTEPNVPTVSCIDNTGMDLFAAETNAALGLSWNNHANFNADGGYLVRYGTVTETYTVEIAVASCTALNCETTLTGLNNDETYYIVVDALDASQVLTGTSCELAATPHVLTFSDDMAIKTSDAIQSSPTIASSWDGKPLFVGWIENDQLVLSRSDNNGDSWSTPAAVLPGLTVQSNPTLTFRRRITQTSPDTGELEIMVKPALFATFVDNGTVKIMRGDFPADDITGETDYPLGELTFSDPVDLDTGNFPATAAYGDHIEVAYEKINRIWVASSSNGGLSFSVTRRNIDKASGLGQTSSRPDVAIDAISGNVFVAYEGKRLKGNNNIYLKYSIDGGANYQKAEIRIDDDNTGSSQSNVSISTDPHTSHIVATWEDTRNNNQDIYFSRSIDAGITWETPNLDSGNGLSGDQFEPVADIDPGRNVIVLFIDASNGQRPLFNQFSVPEPGAGSFDTPREVSAIAGTSGASAKNPALSIDKLGRTYVTWTENRNASVDNIFFTIGQ